MDTDNHIYIDGPINAFRLEGQVNGIKKMIYLFEDHPHTIDQQTKCGTYDSVAVSNYIYKKCKEINQTNITYDLFGEIYASDYYNTSINNNTTVRYIDNYMMMLRTMKYQKNQENMFENIRIHYTDPREYLYHDIINIEYEILDQIDDGQCPEYAHSIFERINDIKEIIALHQNIIIIIRTTNMTHYIEYIKKNLQVLYNQRTNKNIYRNQSYDTAQINDDMHFDQIINAYITRMIKKKDANALKKILAALLFFDKLLNRFNNDLIKKLIVDKLAFLCLDKLNDLIECSDHLINRLKNIIKVNSDKNTNSLCAKFKDEFYIMKSKSLYVYAIIMDMYVLKRFLDKDYIERGILYSGYAHTSNIIYCLIHHMEFKITHVAKNNKKYTIDIINKKIKNNTFTFIADIIDLLLDPNDLQCIDMFYFPENLK